MLIFRVKSEYFNSLQESYEHAKKLKETYYWCKDNNRPLFIDASVDVYSDGDHSGEIQVYFQDRREMNER